MEHYGKSFHMQTPLKKLQTKSTTSLYQDSIQGRDNYTTSHKSYGGISSGNEGSFNEVVEYHRHLSALKDLEELRNQYYEQYLSNLETKVKIQRKNLAKQEEKINQNKRKSKSQQKDYRLPRHDLKHDSEYMRKVTKSRFYHILAARDLMQSKGMLKTKEDEERFWTKASSDKHIWSQPVPSGVPPNTVTNVFLNRFSSMSNSRKPRNHDQHERAVTFSDTPSKSFQHKPNSQGDMESDSQRARSQQLKKFKVKIKFPKLHSFSKILLPPIEPQSTVPLDSKHKVKRLEEFRAKQKAYNIAMVNHAVSAKLMKEHGFIEAKDPPFLLHEMAMLCYGDDKLREKILPLKSQDAIDDEERQVFITEPVYGNDQVLIPELEYKYPSTNVRLQPKSKPVVQPSKREEPTDIVRVKEENEVTNAQHGLELDSPMKDDHEQTKNVLPLNFSMMVNNEALPIKEAKCLSSFWINYAKDQ